MEVTNILHTKTYELTEKKVHRVKNWLGREGFQLIQTFTNSEEDICKTVEGQFFKLGEKIKPHLSEIILSLQYYKL